MNSRPVSITRVRYENFKALGDFTVRLRDMNILVGPNNSGKSTLVSAFRLLEYGLRRANSRKPERIPGLPAALNQAYQPEGYAIAGDIEMVMRNIHTNLSAVPSTVTFDLSNRNKLCLYFPSDDFGVFMLAKTDSGPRVVTPTQFRRHFPITVNAVPVLGPLDEQERPISLETVRRNLPTHRASGNFRSYWYAEPDQFDEFKSLMNETWPGIEVLPPELLGGTTLGMFCVEEPDRMQRELFWAGFGFQIWCQLLTYIVRGRSASLIVVDEPETNLHPDLQRHLLPLLRAASPSVIIATHSGEIVSEADPGELVIIDKSKKSAKRLTDQRTSAAALDILGARQNLALTRLARTRRALFVEGADFAILRRFAARLGLSALSGTADITDIPLGGHRPAEAKVRLAAFEEALGYRIVGSVVLDRDYRSDEELRAIEDDLTERFVIGHSLKRKEIENYALDPEVLRRAIRTAVDRQARRSKTAAVPPEDIRAVLEEITAPLYSLVSSNYLDERQVFLRASGISERTAITSKAVTDWLTPIWSDLESRLGIVPGKVVLSMLNARLQARHGTNLQLPSVIDTFRPAEIPGELQDLLRRLDRFRTRRT